MTRNGLLVPLLTALTLMAGAEASAAVATANMAVTAFVPARCSLSAASLNPERLDLGTICSAGSQPWSYTLGLAEPSNGLSGATVTNFTGYRILTLIY